MPKEVAKASPDRLVAGIAARQHGVVTTAQLQATGLLASGISDRVRAGRLHRIHRGVYAVGHANLGSEGRWMSGVLACGEGAVLSHRSAGELWRMLGRARQLSDGGGRRHVPAVDVTVPTSTGRARRYGIRLHRSRILSPDECTRRSGIPVTKPARTLRDLRRTLPSRQFDAALREAEFLGLPLGVEATTDHTHSELEASFLQLLRRHRLPKPEVNVRVDRFVVDFLWSGERLIVELDGWQAHRTRSAFEHDRARDARLRVLGYHVLRFTWRQVTTDPRDIAKTIRTLLGGV